jgi:hypothetical protein
MSRKDYELLAAALRDVRDTLSYKDMQHVISALALRLQNNNPQFNYYRFREAVLLGAK